MKDPTETKCDNSGTTANGGKNVCKGTVIFEDHFKKTGSLDKLKWITEQYIPTHSLRSSVSFIYFFNYLGNII